MANNLYNGVNGVKKRCIKLFCFILLLSLIITGCSTSLKNENDMLIKEVAALKEEKTALESTISDLNNTVKIQDLRIEELMKAAFRDKDHLYPLYTADSYTYEKRIEAYIYIPKETALKRKLEILANALSEVYFDNLPIQIIRIEEVEKKKIAIVNLKESAINQGITDYEKLVGKTWTMLYMQGSSGGTITETRLIETMLQREYQGQWIDGVQFLYNNETCDYEHAASLKEINYRE
ncbi:MAG: hypothetical protein K0S75_2658 [Clostridia bacterium]|nr:hypothetical protein [Clostridia bacterium]